MTGKVMLGVGVATAAILGFAIWKARNPVSLRDWSESHEARVAIGAAYGMVPAMGTWYNPATGEYMPVEASEPVSGTFQTEVAWINEQIRKSKALGAV